MTTRDLIAQFVDCPILVVGDLMLDEYVWGSVHRISPEAPVPVVRVERRTATLGGVGNSAANIAGLGGRALVVGVVGTDEAGDRLINLLAIQGCNVDGIQILVDRPTTTKTRILAQGQQIVRVDHEQSETVSDATQTNLIARISEKIDSVKGVVVSDYGKGCVTSRLMKSLIEQSRQHGIPVVVDPKGRDYRKYRGATLVKPNLGEVQEVLHRHLVSAADIEGAGQELLEILGGETAVLITQGAHGMTVFPSHGPSSHIPAMTREVFDVTGAGDTVASVIGLALAIGCDLTQACRIASLAASIVVGRIGTTRIEVRDLLQEAPGE